MMGFAFACLLLPGALAFALARWRDWSRARTSALVLCVMLTNAGNYGLSVTLLAFGERGAGAGEPVLPRLGDRQLHGRRVRGLDRAAPACATR